MKARLDHDDAKALHKRRKQTVEPVFGISRSAMRLTRLRPRGIGNVASEWTLIAPACNRRRINPMPSA